jgi:hypothetical protein
MLGPSVAGLAIHMAHRQRENKTYVSALAGAADDNREFAVTDAALAQQGHSRHCRRRRGLCAPLRLCITDHDTGRFTLEGPMSGAEADAWIKEVIAARRANRDITCRIFPLAADQAAMEWGGADGGTHWPSGSIVNPEVRDR